MTIRITNFTGNQFNTDCGIVREYSFIELAKQFCKPIAGPKHIGYFVRGELDPIERKDDNLSYSELLIIDGDSSLDDVKSAPKAEDIHNALVKMNLRHFLYTSHSHNPKENIHKYRIAIHCVLPERKFLKPTALKIIYDLNAVGIPIKYVKEMGTWSQPWFIPSRQDINDGMFEFYYHGDECYDDGRQTFQYEAVKSIEIPETVECNGTQYDTQLDSSTWDNKILKMYDAGTFHSEIRDLLYGFIKDGMTSPMAFKIVKGILDGVPENKRNKSWHREVDEDYKEVKRSLEGVLQKFGVNDTEEKVIRVLESPLPTDVVKDIDWPPGLMGDLARSIHSYSYHQYKLVSIITALALVAGISGRKFNVSGTGLNIYITLLMRTGAGKNVIQQYISEFLSRNILSLNRNFLGPKRFTSPKAMLDILSENPSIVSIQTEAGLMFKSSAGDQQGILRTMLDLYSSSGQNQYSGSEAYSSKDSSIPVLRSPALTIVNEATPQTFEDELIARGSIESGELARMHIFKYDVPKPYRNKEGGVMKLNSKLEAHMNKLMAYCNNQKAVGEGSDPRAKDIPFPDDIFTNFSNACVDAENELTGEDNLKVAMLTRAPVKVLKTAGLLAVMDNQIITEKHWNWALELFHYEFSMLSALIGGTSSAGSDVDDIIDAVLIPTIVKLLNNEYKHANKQLNNKFRKLGIFTYSILYAATKGKKIFGKVSQHGKPGLIRCLEQMESLGYLERVSKIRMQQISLKNFDYSQGYEITTSFAIYWKTLNTRKNINV